MRFIKRAQELGFSLAEIGELLALRVSPQATGAEVRRRAEAKVANIDGKIKTFQAMKKALVRLTAACDGRGSASECPILESLGTERGLL